MLTNHLPIPKKVFQLLNFLLWTTLFAIAYSQSPLFTSNQNQYFLHGMAQAGSGFLDRDWLANTADPTPVFSTLIEWTYRFINWEPIFYIYYALLMGVYLFSLFGIASLLFRVDKSTAVSLIFLALIFLIHSAGLRFTLSRVIGDNWTYVLEDGVADQRMLGTVFQPSSFGVLLALSIYLFLNRRYFPSLIAACLAPIFHPTYLLSAATLTLAYMTIIFLETRQIKLPLIMGGLALVLVSPIVVQSISLFGGTDMATVEKSRQILINFRIPHHALVSQWFDTTALFKIIIILLALILVRKNRLFIILLFPFCIGFILTIIQVFTQNSALALLFPWRVSIFLLPVSVTLLVANFCIRSIGWLVSLKWMSKSCIRTVSMLIILLAVVSGASRFTLDLMRKTNIAERELFSYVAGRKQPTDIYLIPSKMQDFRLETGAPIFVEFKSIPYHDADVLEWYRRVSLNNRFYKDYDCNLLDSLVNEDGITHIVTKNDPAFSGCSFLSNQYQDENYQIFRVTQ